jgi:hypothetical protein
MMQSILYLGVNLVGGLGVVTGLGLTISARGGGQLNKERWKLGARILGGSLLALFIQWAVIMVALSRGILRD